MFRSAEADNEKVCAGIVDHGDDFFVLRRIGFEAERGAVNAHDPNIWPGFVDEPSGAVGDPGSRAEEEDSCSAGGVRSLQEHRGDVAAWNPLRKRLADEARSPDDRIPVGDDKRGMSVRLSESRVFLKLHDMVHVGRDDISSGTGWLAHPVEQEINRFVASKRVDLDIE